MNTSALIDFAVSVSQDLRPCARRWTPADDEFIRANILTMTLAEIGQHLGRTMPAINVRMKKSGLAPATRQPGWYTANQVARILCIDSHSMTQLCRRGILPYVRLPGKDMTKSIRRVTFYRWAVSPKNWIYFKPERVRDPHLRRLIELARVRWLDEWWTTQQIVDYYGLASSNSVAVAIRRGKLDAVRWGNWYVLRSAVMAHPFNAGQGSPGVDRKGWTANAYAFLFKAREEWHLTYAIIARMMKKNEKDTGYRYKLAKRKDRERN